MTTTINIKYFKCCYCGIKQYANSMVIVKDSIREEWSAIFGDEFRRKSEKGGCICMKHLRGFENENEEEDDDFEWFYENNRKICFNTFCCYCGPKTKPIEMCAVTTDVNEMDSWVAILGNHFRINASKLRTPCICLRHFEGNEVLPRGFLNGIPIDVVNELEKKSPGCHPCSLCRCLRSARLLVKVPRSSVFQDWVKVLGADFEQNCQKMVGPQVCRSHVMQNFPDYKLPDLNILDIFFRTPMSTILDLKAYCCYCGRNDIQKRMINVPEDQNTFIDWVCVFGMDFEENCSFFWQPMICRSHVLILTKYDLRKFRTNKKHKPISSNPKPDFSIRRSFRKHEQVKLSDEQKPSMFHQMEPSTSSEFPEDLVLKIEPPEIKQEIKEEIEEEDELDIKPSTSEIVPNIHITPEIAKLIDEAKQYEKLYNPRFGKCCYCRSFLSVKHMIRVPNDPNLFEKWCEILGNTFKLISSSLRYPRICWQHFEDQGIITKRKLIANLKDINVSTCCMYCILTHQSQKPSSCLDIVTIPGSSVKAKKWRKILGIRSNNMNLYICLKHWGKVV